ncbi:flagellar biosynthesis protein FlhB [Pseudoxanthomonas wuyuanensis]|uniref:Flagellar biosynthetic protein FlhB n=1 Tax=Pseudoxanthomonas wuyuanensis TaxID=1073196 RepID=A0A286D022_9GAMM|nr:flagellar biosynthesis protein FlhB [Pseudoxanthomonas wuyuanensis]KAF1722446.1 flagellar biosynthesis protein FlhB [Pseudoxanthomonas wuyuanensis]SOD52010.1 flagellar biosynthetic protein FlhB [Pseudoxanthomonas wuyuanensis]
MAEQDQSGERTEQPTEKRLREAREKGNIPRSRELATAAVFGAGVLAMAAMTPALARNALGWMKIALTPSPELLQRPDALFGHTGQLLLGLLTVVAPVAAICVLAGFAGPLLMGGLRFSSKSLMPDFKRLSPLAGIKRLYGPESIAELLKSLLRVALVGGAAALCLKFGLNQLRALLDMPLEQAARSGLGFTGVLLLSTAGALMLLAAIDAPYQKWNHTRKLKMTRQELRDELKESEGRPEVKGRIRQLQMQMSQRRMMEDVPSADVIVVNPTHYAVALKYDSGKMGAPRVLAKGVDELAFRIREVAQMHKVAIVSSPPLARSLYREGEIGREIPVRLYSAVAQILSYVYQLRAWRHGAAALPTLPDIDVDEGKPLR